MFDIDGTLVNSSKFDEACYLEAARILFGVEIPPDIDDYKHATDSGVLDEVITRYNISGDRNTIHRMFKNVFFNLISEHIANNSKKIQQIKGASHFIKHLQDLPNAKVAFATGGWEETAKLKLKAANINIDGCAFASSSDHYERTEIMKIAESKVLTDRPFDSKTYFGDAHWDKKASETLNYRFILVGNRFEHELQIDDYQRKQDILNILKL